MYGQSITGVRIKGKDYRLQKTKGLKTYTSTYIYYFGEVQYGQRTHDDI